MYASLFAIVNKPNALLLPSWDAVCIEPNERCCCLVGMLSVLSTDVLTPTGGRTTPMPHCRHRSVPSLLKVTSTGERGWSPRSVPHDNIAPCGAPTDNDNLFVTLFFRSSCLSATTWTIPACWARACYTYTIRSTTRTCCR